MALIFFLGEGNVGGDAFNSTENLDPSLNKFYYAFSRRSWRKRMGKSGSFTTSMLSQETPNLTKTIFKPFNRLRLKPHRERERERNLQKHLIKGLSLVNTLIKGLSI
ncbi:hypothetical protein ACJW30_01G195500 [Castanea mollissima]